MPIVAAAAIAVVPVQAATQPDALVIGMVMDTLTTFDPADVSALEPSEVVANFYDRLVEIAPADLSQVLPSLAESWEYDGEGRVLTFELRSDATFSGGDPVLAEDVAWSLQRVLKLEMVAAGELRQWGFTADNAEQSFVAVDEDTFQVHLPEDIAPELFLVTLAGTVGSVLDRDEVLRHEQNGDLGRNWLISAAAGSGPFTLTDWRPNNILIATRRDDYWGGAPQIRRVMLRHIPESGSQRLQLEAGDLDVAKGLNTSDLGALANKDDFTIERVQGFGFYVLALNQEVEALANPLVREAFRHMLDWPGLAGSVMQFSGIPHQNVVPQGMVGASNALPYDFDLERARELLAEAGYADGFSVSVYPSSASSPFMELAESLQATAAQVGVNVEIVAGNNADRFRNREDYQIFVGRTTSKLPDPLGTLQTHASNPDNSDESRNTNLNAWRVAWDTPELTAMVDALRKPLDPEKRQQLIIDIRELYDAQSPAIIPFFQRVDAFARSANVEGYVGSPIWVTRWDTVTKQ
ncbi:MAG: ABC transporter substrate-binding protein [Devosia ginsengisoli]|nr:ABC transporter substrate-binding protein [Devosia ginsengisoli]